jgi:hypothetical protein
MLVHVLHPELKGGDRAGIQRRGEAVGKGAADIERRDQVKLARPALRPFEPAGEVGVEGEIVVQDYSSLL